MICESEDRLTGRVIIVVARTTDYCFLCNRKSSGISYCIKSPPGRSHCGGLELPAFSENENGYF